MSTVLASAPASCCLKTIQHEGTPSGSKITVSGLQTYQTGDKENNQKIILFFPDVFGPFYINTQLLADYFASCGYLVVAPDYFEGDYLQDNMTKPGFDFTAWVTPIFEKAKVTTPKWIDAVMKDIGTKTTQYVTVGYCFGAPFALDLLATDKVTSGAIAHPAFLDDSHFRNVKKPLFLSCAEVDITFPNKSRHVSEEILAEIKATYQYQLFSGIEHGFALRGNMENENERWAKEESAKGILGWWARFLK